MKPADESERLRELHALNIIDTPSEERFDRHIRLIADTFNMPAVWLALVDVDRLWFKSVFGYKFDQTRREDSICTHTLNLGYLEIPDLLEDRFFRDHPAVKTESPIRFYAGTVIYGPTGQPIGTLCIADGAPRRLKHSEQSRLKTFALIIQHELISGATLENYRRLLQHSAKRDPKTGLPGEKVLEEVLGNIIQTAEVTQSQHCIMQLHLENLETVGSLHNRREGQNAMVLALVDRLAALDKGIAITGRIGRDRLVLIVPKTSRDEIKTLAKRILISLTNPIKFNDRLIRPVINVGISVYPDNGTKARLLMVLAERAFRLSEGHHKITFYEAASDEKATRRDLIQDRLEMALVNNRITLTYQPIWLADGTRIVKFEALARWQDEELGVVFPGEFVPIIEKNPRLSRMLTYNVLRMACMEARVWKKYSGPHLPSITVNIPAWEFHQPEFADTIFELLKELDLDPNRLVLELTEEGLVQDIDQAICTMTQLSKAGITLALDDFGTGYSSLNHFKRLPIDVLKIDKSFIDSLPGCNKDLELVSGIIRIAHAIGLVVVAEGVEHEVQRDVLRELGCDMIQGYLLGRPVTADHISEMIKCS